MRDVSPLVKIISGGQAGVDRAALDVAIALGLSCGGWVPRGRGAEDGVVPRRYPLRETRGRGYAERTRLNVRDADGTLVLTRGRPVGGTALTVAFARRLGRPHLLVDFQAALDPAATNAWIARRGIRVLNVAGPRESTCPGIYQQAYAFVLSVLTYPAVSPHG